MTRKAKQINRTDKEFKRGGRLKEKIHAEGRPSKNKTNKTPGREQMIEVSVSCSQLILAKTIAWIMASRELLPVPFFRGFLESTKSVLTVPDSREKSALGINS